MNGGWLFLWGGTLASSGSGWGWHAALRGMPTCLGPVYTGKNSKSCLTRLAQGLAHRSSVNGSYHYYDNVSNLFFFF